MKKKKEKRKRTLYWMSGSFKRKRRKKLVFVCFFEIGEEDEKLKAKCPECHADIILPANVNVDAGGGLNGLKCHPFVQRLLEEEKIDVNANPNGGICEFCDRNQATSLCSACNQIICDDCQKGHKKIKDHWKP